MERQRLKYGDRVKWLDPGINDYDPEDMEWAHNRIFVIDEIEDDDDIQDRLMHITEENGFSDAEVFEHELIFIGER